MCAWQDAALSGGQCRSGSAARGSRFASQLAGTGEVEGHGAWVGHAYAGMGCLPHLGFDDQALGLQLDAGPCLRQCTAVSGGSQHASGHVSWGMKITPASGLRD